MRAEARRHRVQVERQLASIVELEATELSRWRKARLDDASICSDDPRFAALVEQASSSPRDAGAREELRDWLGRHLSRYEHIALLDPAGRSWLAVPEDAVPDSLRIRESAAEVARAGAPRFEDFYENQQDGRTYLDVLVPIFGDSGTAMAVVEMRIDPETYLFPFLDQWPTPYQTVETLLVRRHGDDVVILNAPEPPKGSTADARSPSIRSELLDAAALEWPEGILQGRDHRGVPSVAALRAVPDSPWYLVARLDAAEIDAPLHARLWEIFLVIAGLLVIAAAGVGLVWRGRNIRDLRERYLAEREQALLIEGVTDYAILTLAPDGRIATWNAGAERLNGYRAKDIVGQHVSCLYAEEDRARGKPGRDLERATREGRAGHEGWRIRKDGSRFLAEVVITSLRDEEGGLWAFAQVTRDITERNRTEGELRDSEARFRRVVQHINDALIVDDIDGNVVFANDRFFELFGFDRDDPRPLTLEDYVAPEWRESLRDRHDRRVGGRVVPTRFDYEGLGPNKERLWLEASVVTLSDDSGRVIGSQSVIRDATERHRTERALQRSRDLLDITAHLARIGGWELDLESQSLSWSDEVYRIHELDPATEPDVAKAIDFYAPEARPLISAAVQAGIDSGTPWDLELPMLTARGRHIWVRAQGQAERRHGKTVRLFGAFQDVTKRHETEEMLRQSQKVEAIGQLAGGVAHDFNNILGVILGFGELAEAELAPDDPAHSHLAEINRAAHHAADLTRQLQSFARKQNLKPRSLDLNAVVAKAQNMLRRLIGGDVHLVARCAEDLWPVMADPTQIDQVVLNLAINARDAMPQGGTLTLETANVEPGPQGVVVEGSVLSGEHVVLAVSDTGVGMDAATRDRIFEPFFTTKPEGQGTGLGLATVYGIVKQSAGHISVHTELGRGTTFRIYLARSEETVEKERVPEAPAAAAGDGEVILLAEDNEALRKMIERQLTAIGYEVVAAANGEQALALARSRDAPIDLLLTDVVMPKLGGEELARQMRLLDPGIRVVYMSGYGDGAVDAPGTESRVLEKPFANDELGATVRELLDRPLAV